MERKYPFLDADERLKLLVWMKGNIAPGQDGAVFRTDSMGSTMKYSEHGNRDSDVGWEIDHIIPNGDSSTPNLQPLQWRNNVEKGDKMPD